MQEIDGVPLLRRSALRAKEIGPLTIALPPSPHPRYGAVEGLDASLVPVPDAAEGMNASLRRAVSRISPQSRALMVVLADLPELTTDDLRSVCKSMADHPQNLIWRGAAENGAPGHPVIFDRSLVAELQVLTGDGGAQSIVRACKGKVHMQRLPGQNALLDLDTPEDWARWRAAR